ncbi:histidinol-phosphate transaminase [Aquipuribacter nitratireducens]|uniref:Histidinol-phosphate aminotransferase n=1 Tax=Aquipuribacter nitratireducens TaxID=650104 RepID=A0ABW0GQF4_9MICO
MSARLDSTGLPLRPDLRGRTAYGAPQLDVPVRLNTNESSYALPPAVAAAVTEAVAAVVPGLNRYPDRDFAALRDALAAWLVRSTGVAVAPDEVWAANGSNEVLQHLLQAFGGPGRTALGFTPAYSMHPIISASTGTSWVDGTRPGSPGDPFDLTADSAAEQARRVDPDVVFLCSPNNPTGTALDLDVVRAVHEAAPHAVVVVDEAYAEFARPGTPSAVTQLDGRVRLVVTRTMSKAFAFAGARLGYLAADAAVTAALRLVRLPYHLSSLTQAAAVAALAHADELLSTVEALKEQRDRVVAGTAALGLRPVPSDANFVLVGGFADSGAAFEALLAHGVLVRDVGLPGYLRMTAGTPAETDALLAALGDVLGDVRGAVVGGQDAPAGGGCLATRVER